MTESENAQLDQISHDVFGDGMKLMVVNPNELTLLKENARYFKRETFRQLRDNIAADKKLSSVPLCYRYEENDKVVLEVLSGNHRVQASRDAGLNKILVLVITEELSKSRRIAIQLGHNALVGEDDQSILANLWAQIDDLNDRLYSGLDSEALAELGEVELVNFSTPQVSSRVVSFMFTDSELERFDDVLAALEDEAKKSARVYLGSLEGYERLMGLVAGIKGAEKIRDNSLAMVMLMELGEKHLAEGGAQ